MKFLYKIHSGFDGFRPNVIENRLDAESRLRLGWAHYLDSVDEGSEVWVYFKGPHRFENGVYAKGVVEVVDLAARQARLGQLEYDLHDPLTDAETSERVAEVVRNWGQQVFVFPDELDRVAVCTIAEKGASSCADRGCAKCETWRALPRIDPATLQGPERLGHAVDPFVPAFWVLPPRGFLYYTRRTVAAGVRRTSELFHRFKFGEAPLAYPLALGIYTELRDQAGGDFDAIVPIPLSPEKEQNGEIHRTLLLANELSTLLDVPVVQALELDRAVSKRALQRQGITDERFEAVYRDALALDEEALGNSRSVLLVDDVCTKGSTLTVAAEILTRDGRRIVAAAAGQMAVRAVVRDEEPLLV